MDASDIRREYLEWLCKMVNANEKWHFLWHKLHDISFVWSVGMDENRAADGKYLRYLYSLECSNKDISEEEIDEILSGPCSVLEFLVGLAKRIEDDVMYDVDKEDRTSKWFWEMIHNLGLDIYDDAHYSDVKVDDIVNRFMSRKYSKNGSGNIFKFLATGQKIRDLEIWDQVQLWVRTK